jgi:hypothetical protein
MVEVVMATAIVGGLAAAAMTLAASSAGHKINAANVARGKMLCRSLAEEASVVPIADWSTDGLDITIAKGENTVSGTDAKSRAPMGKTGWRSLFTTLDHYDGYSESPPMDGDDNTISGYTGWTRTVDVEIVTFANPGTISASETGLRRVTVSALYSGKTIATTTFLRSSEWERVQP